METMKLCEALDTRDFLKKKIMDDLGRLNVVVAKAKGDEKIGNKYTVDEYKAQATAAYQSIKDMIDRYDRCVAAIVVANAQTMITLSNGKTMSIAAAISLRKELKETSHYAPEQSFLRATINMLSNQYNKATAVVEAMNENADSKESSLKNVMFSKVSEKSVSTEDLKTIEVTVDKYKGELIDPLDVSTLVVKLTNDLNVIVSELETKIKIANATTDVTF